MICEILARSSHDPNLKAPAASKLDGGHDARAAAKGYGLRVEL